jgi:corrinoid protein of di/trimethylamine methyltransferase
MEKKELFARMAQSIIEGDREEAVRFAELALKEKLPPIEVIEEGYSPGIRKVGELWEKGEYFLPELVSGAECMKMAMEVLKPALESSDEKLTASGKVVIATVQGDIHDIGKSLVATTLAASGFEVIDLGADVPIAEIVKTAYREEADIICTSALLTTTMIGQKRLIEILESEGARERFKVMVGGAPVSASWARKIGADAYGDDAMEAVTKAKELLARR